jgi:hypothetical protein
MPERHPLSACGCTSDRTDSASPGSEYGPPDPLRRPVSSYRPRWWGRATGGRGRVLGRW